MTARGGGHPEALTAPVDPTLMSRPVPNRLSPPMRTFGPGAAPALQTRKFRRDIPAAANSANPGASGRQRASADNRRLLSVIDDCATQQEPSDRSDPPLMDRTWGYYVFLTDYSAATSERLSQALEKFIQLQMRVLDSPDAPPEFRNGLRKRFKPQIVEDEGQLAGVSNDRVREVFRALLRDMDLADEDDRFPCVARHCTALSLDAAAVNMLAALQFDEYEGMRTMQQIFRDETAWEGKCATVVDANFNGTPFNGGSYPGNGHIGISDLGRFYLLITSDAHPGAMEDMHPLRGTS